MGKKPSVFHLKAHLNNELFVLGTLSFNLSKIEISFHLHRSETAPCQQKDIEQGIVTDPIDHITWHEKIMHIRTKNKTLQKIQYSTVNLLPQQKTIIPLYVEGFFLNKEISTLGRDATFCDWKESDEVLIIESSHTQNFSLVFFLVPEDWMTSYVFLQSEVRFKNGAEIPLFYLRAETHEIGRIKAFQGWDILIFTTPYTRELPPIDPVLGNSYRLPDYVSPIDSLASILQQAKSAPSLDNETIQALHEAHIKN